MQLVFMLIRVEDIVRATHKPFTVEYDNNNKSNGNKSNNNNNNNSNNNNNKDENNNDNVATTCHITSQKKLMFSSWTYLHDSLQ